MGKGREIASLVLDSPTPNPNPNPNPNPTLALARAQVRTAAVQRDEHMLAPWMSRMEPLILVGP